MCDWYVISVTYDMWLYNEMTKQQVTREQVSTLGTIDWLETMNFWVNLTE